MAQVAFAPILANQRSGETLNLPVEANTNVFTGTIGAIDAAGNLTFAQDTAGYIVAGRIESDGPNGSGAAGALSVNVRRGAFNWQNSSTNPLSNANIGQACYVQDEQTLTTFAGSANKVVAGIFLGLDPNDGTAWVDTRFRGSVLVDETAIVDDTTGVAVAPVAGVVTIPAVTTFPTAANAIATLIAEVAKLKALLK